MNSSLVIDLGNLHRNFMSKYGKKINYEKLIKLVNKENTVVNIYAFGTLKGASSAFCRALECLGVNVTLVRYNHNIELAVCLTQLNTPSVIFGSDDLQYGPALNVLRERGTLLTRYSCYNQSNNIFHKNVELTDDLSYEQSPFEQQLELPTIGNVPVLSPSV